MSESARPRILIVKLSSLGDVVHSLPVVSALRRRYPQAHLGWCVGRKAAALVAGHPLLDVTFVLDAQAPGEEGPVVRGGWRELGRSMRAHRFEVALDLQGLLKSAWLAYLSGARRRVSYQTWQEGAFLLNRVRAIPPARSKHAVEGYLDFARYLDAPGEPVEFVVPTCPERERRAEALLAQVGAGKEAAMILPSTLWESKQWPAVRLGETAGQLAAWGLRPLVLGGPVDRERCEAVVAAAGGAAVSLAGKTEVADLAPLLARARLVVGNDSGPVHLAAALGVPVVAGFGPTNPTLTRPYGERVAVVRAEVACSPCRRRRCPSLICQDRVQVADVTAAAGRLLGLAA